MLQKKEEGKRKRNMASFVQEIESVTLHRRVNRQNKLQIYYLHGVELNYS